MRYCCPWREYCFVYLFSLFRKQIIFGVINKIKVSRSNWSKPYVLFFFTFLRFYVFLLYLCNTFTFLSAAEVDWYIRPRKLLQSTWLVRLLPQSAQKMAANAPKTTYLRISTLMLSLQLLSRVFYSVFCRVLVKCESAGLNMCKVQEWKCGNMLREYG